MVGAEEQDAYSRYLRKYMCWTQRAGRVKQVKQRTHRRERREGRLEARGEG